MFEVGGIDCADGREIGAAVVDYPSGHQGTILNPGDHHLALEQATLKALKAAKPAGYLYFSFWLN